PGRGVWYHTRAAWGRARCSGPGHAILAARPPVSSAVVPAPDTEVVETPWSRARRLLPLGFSILITLVAAPLAIAIARRLDDAGPERMVAAASSNGVRRFIYLSGAGTRPGRTEPWFRAKERAERAITASGMEYVILRPSWIYGPDDRSMNKFVAFVKYLP